MADPSPQPKPVATALKRAAIAVAITLAGLVSWWWLSDRLDRSRSANAALVASELEDSETAQRLRADAAGLAGKLADLALEFAGLREEIRAQPDRIAARINAAMGEVSRDVAKLQAEVVGLQQFERFTSRDIDRLTAELAELRERLEALEKR